MERISLTVIWSRLFVHLWAHKWKCPHKSAWKTFLCGWDIYSIPSSYKQTWQNFEAKKEEKFFASNFYWTKYEQLLFWRIPSNCEIISTFNYVFGVNLKSPKSILSCTVIPSFQQSSFCSRNLWSAAEALQERMIFRNTQCHLIFTLFEILQCTCMVA